MLRLKSKPIVIALSSEGIAIRFPNNRAELASNLEGEFSLEAIQTALEPYAAKLKQQGVRIVLSNHFVRYLVLPWELNITSRDDWLSLADQAFREHYGASASDWSLRVNLNQHGAPVVASAMDQQLLDNLTALSTSFQCKITAIEPLLMTTSTRHKSNESFMIAEPGRLLFCELENSSISQITAISPPRKQEYNSARQLITRYFLQNNHRALMITSYLSSVVNAEWETQAHNSTKERIVALNKLTSLHACWLAEL